MQRGIGLRLLASACVAGLRRRKSSRCPPLRHPLPPNSNPSPDPQWELGVRYWWSEAQTRYDFTSSRVSPNLGDPTSVLDYDGLGANSLEFMWSVRSETDTVFRGFIGGGWLNGGSLDDEDYFVGQIKFSDTYSRVDDGNMGYGTIDLAQDFVLAEAGPRIVVGPFVGFNYWQEDLSAYGVRCNRDDAGGLFCSPCGSAGNVVVPLLRRSDQQQGELVVLAPRCRIQSEALEPADHAYRCRHPTRRQSLERGQPLSPSPLRPRPRPQPHR